MSVSSNSRKESTESFAAQQMHSTMGQAPDGLGQLNDRSLENDLPSKRAESSDTDVPGDVMAADALIAEADDERASEKTGMSQTDIDEASRASWGQPAGSANAGNVSSAHQHHNATITSDNDRIADADWNTTTEDGAIPATRINEPDRTLGNS